MKEKCDPYYSTPIVKQTVRLCQLEDGSIVHYDAMSEKGKNEYNPDIFQYIGSGQVYSINGIRQGKSKNLEYFYRRINK